MKKKLILTALVAVSLVFAALMVVRIFFETPAVPEPKPTLPSADAAKPTATQTPTAPPEAENTQPPEPTVPADGQPQPTPAQTSEPLPTPSPTPAPTPTPTPTPKPERPDVDVSSWEFILANPTHEIGNYAPDLAGLENGHFFDSRAVDALKEFIAAGRAAGYSVVVNSSYRDYDTQKYLYDRKVAQYGGDTATAASIVAPPGTSEHQTGLCADIADQFYATKDSSLENTATFKWLKEHCAEYGFILRYPKNKQEITGIIYEPWHFRYVGKEAARFIMDNGLCLEEFLALYP